MTMRRRFYVIFISSESSYLLNPICVNNVFQYECLFILNIVVNVSLSSILQQNAANAAK